MFKSLAESPTVNIDCWPPVNTAQLYGELQFSAAFAIAPNRVRGSPSNLCQLFKSSWKKF